MTVVSFDLTLTVRSPFIIGGAEQMSSALDEIVLRDATGKHAIVPGTMVKGLLRDALASLADLGHPALFDHTVLTTWFGDESARGLDNTPERGSWTFGDLCSIETIDTTSDHYTRVAIDDDSGTASEGALQFIEMPWPVGTKVHFKGRIGGIAVDQADRVKTLLDQAFLAIPAVGQLRTMGFGKVLAAEVNKADATAHSFAAVEPDKDILMFVAFDGPFVVSADQLDSNSFIGQHIIPGGVLKGAIADRVGAAISAEALAGLTIGHGFPVLHDAHDRWADHRPLPLPLSLAHCPGGPLGEAVAVVDRLGGNGDALVDRGPTGYAPLAFAPDWKPCIADQIARTVRQVNQSNPIEPLTSVRTRAAIDGDRGAARDGKLYSMQMVHPLAQIGGKHTSLDWAFRLHGDANAMQSLLDVLEITELAIGKTKTRARIIDAKPVVRQIAPTVMSADGKAMVRITLVCDATITSYARFEKHHGDMRAAYSAYFADIAQGLTLEDHYAAQRLLTGYQAVRFKSSPQRFEPWIATLSGSTFLLSLDAEHGGAETLAGLVRHWLDLGLPPDPNHGTESWRHIPYPRENGYGQILAGELTLPPLPQGVSIVEVPGHVD